MEGRGNRKEHWVKRLSVAVMLLFIGMGITGKLCAEEAWGQPTDDETMFYHETVFRIEYFYYNTCAACHPEEDFYQIVETQLSDLKAEYSYEIYEYNTFHLDDKERLAERLKELGLDQEMYAEPLVLIGDTCLSGLEEIREEIRGVYLALAEGKTEWENGTEEVLSGAAETETVTSPEETEAVQNGEVREKEQQDSVWKADLRRALEADEESDSVILYFSTYSCDDCSRVKELLGDLETEILLTDGSLSAVKIHEFNIMEEDYVELVQYLFAAYEVPSEKQQVPILFYREGYLSGTGDIRESLSEELAAGRMTNAPDNNRLAEALGDSPASAQETAGSYLSLILTGLINGLNPCGASMLLMLLAAAAMAGSGVWKVGCAYLAGKFAAYFAMGFGLYSILGAVSGELLFRISRGLTWGIAALFLVLAVMYLLDFVHVKRQEYDKIRMQLPSALRKWNHDKIERMSKVHGKWLLPAVAVLGVIISAGEFFCTGQVYLAAILYLMKMQEQRTVQTLTAFLLYVSAMCLPSLILVIIIEKTRNVIRASNATVRWLPFIKLATALVFLILAIVLLVI